MQGVTTALVGFILVCIVFPNLVKSRAQYYAAFAAICFIVILDALGLAIGGATSPMGAFRVFVYVATAALQVFALLLLFLSCGGLSWRELAGDMRGAIEVIRRGGEEKEIVIPLSAQMAELKARRAREEPHPVHVPSTDPGPIVINDPVVPPAAAPAPPGERIPLEP